MEGREELTGSSPIAAYADGFSFRPGDTVRVMVSTILPAYRAELVQLIGSETSRDGDGYRERVIDAVPPTLHTGRVQPFVHGSFVEVSDDPALELKGSFTLQAWIYPTTPERSCQALIARVDASGRGVSLEVDPAGGLMLTSNGAMVETAVPLAANRWYFVAAAVDAGQGEVTLVQRPTPEWPSEPTAARIRRRLDGPTADTRWTAAADTPLLLAAAAPGERHFNGRIDRPRIFSAALTDAQLDALFRDDSPAAIGAPLLAGWDFSREIATDRVHDVGPNGLHGRTVNLPARAMTDHTWRGEVLDWTLDASAYGAIHFHDDDLEDAGWATDFTLTLPAGLASGIYAVRLSAEGAEDHVPLFVRPPAGKRTSGLLYLQSTNTHMAYANWQSPIVEERARARGFPYPYPHTPGKRYAIEHRLLSLYDRHSDGSGVCYSTRLRPIMNLRPKMNDEPAKDGLGYAHGLKADLHVAGWLSGLNMPYDAASDEDLDADGVDLLAGYRVVLTGTHPEYWTARMLDAAEAYLAQGGRFIYLGGNGFYWVTSYDAARPHVIEVRRWGGTQAWTANVGEYHHSTSGELGGLWRERGRAPQRLVGVGFTAQGNARAQPYRRTPASHDPRAAWIFAGVADDEPIGTAGLVMDGAAAFEIDRADAALGTPPHALVVATATGFSDDYQFVVEEVASANSQQSGSVEPRVRADMTFFETPNDGAVFSVGSIAFGGSLSENGYRNAVARITENVVRGFLVDGPLPGHQPSGRVAASSASTR